MGHPVVCDGVHYETLLPATHEDSLLTIELVMNWRQGDFNITHRDIDDARRAAASNIERGVGAILAEGSLTKEQDTRIRR